MSRFARSGFTRKFSQIIATYLNPGDMQQIKEKYNEKYSKQFDKLIYALEIFEIPRDKEILLASLSAINIHLKKLLSKIRVLFEECSKKCTAKINNTETRKQLKQLQLSDAYAYAQVCKTEKVQKCIQFMTLVGLFETKLAKVNKLADSVLNNRATRGKTSSQSNDRKSISPNISISVASNKIDANQFVISPNISHLSDKRRRRHSSISPDSSDNIDNFKQLYAEFLRMISRKMKGGKTRRLSKKNLDF